MSNAPSKPVSFSRPKVGYFSNRLRTQNLYSHVSVVLVDLETVDKDTVIGPSALNTDDRHIR